LIVIFIGSRQVSGKTHGPLPTDSYDGQGRPIQLV
jgi:hypothetical protein